MATIEEALGLSQKEMGNNNNDKEEYLCDDGYKFEEDISTVTVCIGRSSASSNGHKQEEDRGNKSHKQEEEQDHNGHSLGGNGADTMITRSRATVP